MNSRSWSVEQLQSALERGETGGWLFYDFRGSDPVGQRILGLNPREHATRRWFYFIPRIGKPVKLVHRIESGKLDALPGEKLVYLSWTELESHLRAMLGGIPSVAMQYSKRNVIPYVSLVDGGTIDLVRDLGVEVVSSADLLQRFESVLTQEQYDGHRKAAAKLVAIVKQAFQVASEQIRLKGKTTEIEIQNFIMECFGKNGLETDFPPIVGVNANSGDPHYMPSAESSQEVKAGDFLLIDLWAREAAPDTIFADITWSAFMGPQVPERIERIFKIVTEARDRGVRFLNERISRGLEVFGWEVDDVVRNVIKAHGFGDSFIHRTGHNLGSTIHGNGVHFDNLETHDTRQVVSGIACTIEPGIYLPEFGVRSEINVYTQPDGLEVTTEAQTSVMTFSL